MSALELRLRCWTHEQGVRIFVQKNLLYQNWKKKIIAPTKNTNQMIMSMRDELHLIGKGVPEPYKNQEEIELFKCKL